MFRCGQKVVYIKDRFEPWEGGRDTLLTKGNVYTVKSLFNDGTDTPCLTLYEVDPSPAPGWWIGAFRPVTERKTDISVFKKMLDPTKKLINADV